MAGSRSGPGLRTRSTTSSPTRPAMSRTGAPGQECTSALSTRLATTWCNAWRAMRTDSWGGRSTLTFAAVVGE